MRQKSAGNAGAKVCAGKVPREAAFNADVGVELPSSIELRQGGAFNLAQFIMDHALWGWRGRQRMSQPVLQDS